MRVWGAGRDRARKAAQGRCQFSVIRPTPRAGVTRRVENRSVAQTVMARGSTPTADDLEWEVGLLAKVGYCIGPSFSANGDRVAFISDISGIPQAWAVGVEGGWPDRVSALEDQVVGLAW